MRKKDMVIQAARFSKKPVRKIRAVACRRCDIQLHEFALVPAEMAKNDIYGNAMKPGSERGTSLEIAQLLPQLYENVLSKLFRQEAITAQPSALAGNITLIAMV
ncbi:MAG TPA: hypothetical protein VLA83_13635 [Candidatus Binatia bacterium]|nr:hypothetical protein [Candidatus Binatia bacterium]